MLADLDTSRDVTASSTVGITAGPQAGLLQDFEFTGLVAGVGALGLLILFILLVMLLRKKRKRRKRNQQVKKIESSASLDNLDYDDDDESEMRMQKRYAQESAHSIMSRPSHPRAHGPQPAGVPYGGNVDRGHAYPGQMRYY